jgi:hypothetical protein
MSYQKIREELQINSIHDKINTNRTVYNVTYNGTRKTSKTIVKLKIKKKKTY